MDLYHHSNPPFTKWIVAEGLLTEPFVVIDIGVQGGEHPRWQFLGDYAEIHGFDPIAEVIDDLRKRSDGRGRYYHHLALGNEDGQRNFHVSANRFNSSFYSSDPAAEERLVTVRRLDTLYRDRVIPRADYIKLDCEGFEPEILRGARQYLAEGDVLCVTAETNFNISPTFLRTHFHAVNDILVDYGFLVHDINEIRSATAAYSAALAARPPRIGPRRDATAFAMGRLATCDVVFCRNFAEEWRNPENFGRGARHHPAADTLIKSMINFELHGLMDCAVDLAVTFRAVLSPRLDVDRAVDLLLMPPPHPRNTADVIVWLQAEQRSLCNRVRRFVYRIPPLRVINRVVQKLLRKHAGPISY